METQILEDIGLTRAEIKVYLSLLGLGTATAGPIIEKSGLQSSVVHMTLGKLVEKGFASFYLEGKRRHYQAANPAHISEYLREKQERFEEILPQLLAEQEGKVKSEAVSFQGIRGIRELLYELLEAGGGEHHTFGSTIKSLMMGEAWWVSYHKTRAKKGIKARLLFNESLASWKAEAKYPKSEVKYTKTGFEPLTETIIRNDRIGIIVWTDKPIGVLIRNRAAAQSYDNFFWMLWNAAKK